MINNLIINYYKDKNPERAKEIDFCVLENINNPTVDNIVIICNSNDAEHLNSFVQKEFKQKIIPIIVDKRPTYNDYFQLLTRFFPEENNLNVISNADIIISSEALTYMPFYFQNRSTCLALTRWDINNINDYKNNSTLFNTPDSQDTWVFKGAINHINGADFTLGVCGCDNSIAYLLEQAGYNVLNPSKTIKTYHFHLTNIRNYVNVVGQAIERIPPPYKLMHPTV